MGGLRCCRVAVGGGLRCCRRAVKKAPAAVEAVGTGGEYGVECSRDSAAAALGGMRESVCRGRRVFSIRMLADGVQQQLGGIVQTALTSGTLPGP